MTRSEKTKPIPHDEVAAAQEADRRESLKLSDPVQRGIKLAQQQALSNARGELSQRLADLQKCTLKRDFSTAGRDAYNRCHAGMVKAAERLAEITGERFTVPAWLAPPTAAEQPTVVIGAPKSTATLVVRDDGTQVAVDTAHAYKETKGHGPSGKGLSLRGPGSNVDPDWVNK